MDDFLVVAYSDRSLDFIDVIQIKGMFQFIDPDDFFTQFLYPELVKPRFKLPNDLCLNVFMIELVEDELFAGMGMPGTTFIISVMESNQLVVQDFFVESDVKIKDLQFLGDLG